MTSSRGDRPPEREIQRALSSDVADGGAIDPQPFRVPKALLLCLHFAQTTIAGIFCWVCYRAYRGELPSELEQWWTACLVLLAAAWMGALPLLGWMWRFAPALEARLSSWALYWLGLLALPVFLIPSFTLASMLRRSQGTEKRRLPEISLLVGVVTTWPIMHVAAYLACEKALPMTLLEDSALPPYWSIVLVYGTCLALPLALTGMALHVRRRRLAHAADARRMATGKGILMPGEVVVSGIVELAEGETQAVEVQIDQVGTEQESSGTWSHTWTETRRRLTVRPFYLRTAAGERVRVLAGDHAKLMDALDGKILVNRTARTCTAELTPGETVSAFGQLSRGRDPEAAPQAGYRSGAVGWILRPPEGGRMLLSSYPIDRPFQERARRIMWGIATLLVVVVIGQLSLLGYHLRVARGQPIAATVTDTRVVTEKTDEGDEVSRFVTVRLPSASAERDRTLVREVTEESYPNATAGRTTTVLREPVLSTMNFGEHPTVSFWLLVEVVLVVLICFSLGTRDRPDARWYLESKVVEQGSGRLPDLQPETENSLSEIRALVDQEFSQKS